MGKKAKKTNGAKPAEESRPVDLYRMLPPSKPLRSKGDVAEYLEDELAVWLYALTDLAHCGIHVSSDMFSDLASIVTELARVLETGEPSRFLDDGGLPQEGMEELARLVREFSASINEGNPHARLTISAYEEDPRSLPILATALGRAVVGLYEEQEKAKQKVVQSATAAPLRRRWTDCRGRRRTLQGSREALHREGRYIGPFGPPHSDLAALSRAGPSQVVVAGPGADGAESEGATAQEGADERRGGGLSMRQWRSFFATGLIGIGAAGLIWHRAPGLSSYLLASGVGLEVGRWVSWKHVMIVAVVLVAVSLALTFADQPWDDRLRLFAIGLAVGVWFGREQQQRERAMR